MPLRSTTAAELAADLGRFDALIDARSPAEFALDHLPGAINWPVLDDAQRSIVGTLYAQTSALEARKLGAAMVARNIADHLDRWITDKPRDWQPLVYCWRGGQRSGALAWFLDQIGFRTARLAGGYKGFRSVIRQDLKDWPARLDFHVLAGRTGSGKTRLLQALAAEGAQVLDLEAIACHRGSILGGLPGQPQPAQKLFDSRLWQALRQFKPEQPVFVESESKKIGRLQVPDALIARLHQHSTVLRVEMGDAARIELLLQDYGFFAQDVERFCALLDGLIALRGREPVGRWQALARSGQWAEVFGQMMTVHYDPLYLRSIDRNYASYAIAPQLLLADGGPACMSAMARQLVQGQATQAPSGS